MTPRAERSTDTAGRTKETAGRLTEMATGPQEGAAMADDGGWGFADAYAMDEEDQGPSKDLADVQSDDWRNILVLGRATKTGVHPETLALVGHARYLADELGCRVEVLLAGSDLDAATDTLRRYAVDHLYRVEAPDYAPIDHTAKILEQVVKKRRPELVMLFQSRTGDAITAYAANRFGVGYVLAAKQVTIDTNERMAVVTHQGGDPEFQIVTRMAHYPQFVSVQRGLFRTPMEDPYASTQVHDLEVDVGQLAGIQVVEHRPPPEPTIDNAQRVVVAGGRITGKDDLEAARRLADALDAVLGVTQGIVDRGLAEDLPVVDQLAEHVHPRLFVAVGCQGALDLMEAIQGEPTLVTIGSGDEDPINDKAAYRVPGTVAEGVKQVLEAL